MLLATNLDLVPLVGEPNKLEETSPFEQEIKVHE
jgi:hypothetical protein